ncbi:hypothetical protein PAPHI01_2767, partial [Pancytospora philotis]
MNPRFMKAFAEFFLDDELSRYKAPRFLYLCSLLQYQAPPRESDKRLYSSGMSQRKIAQEMGVCKSTVQRITAG